MNHTQSLRRSVLLGLVVLAGAGDISAQDNAPSLWDRFNSAVSQQADQFQSVLENQHQMTAEEQTLQDQLNFGQRMRVMHREAAFLSALNIAWIHDELENWDCGVAAQKAREVEVRIAELRSFEQQLINACSVLDEDAGNQLRVCESQRSDLTQLISELNGLSSSYTAACPLP